MYKHYSRGLFQFMLIIAILGPLTFFVSALLNTLVNSLPLFNPFIVLSATSIAFGSMIVIMIAKISDWRYDHIQIRKVNLNKSKIKETLNPLFVKHRFKEVDKNSDNHLKKLIFKFYNSEHDLDILVRKSKRDNEDMWIVMIGPISKENKERGKYVVRDLKSILDTIAK